MSNVLLDWFIEETTEARSKSPRPSDMLKEIAALDEIERLRELLEVVKNSGRDLDNGIDEEWCFVEDAAEYIGDNL